MRGLFLLALAGCQTATEKIQEESVGDGSEEVVLETVYSLSLELGSDSGLAGGSIPYTLQFSDDLGEPYDVSWTLQSDIDAALHWTEESIRPTTAGSHNIIATVEHEGLTYIATDSLQVAADEVYGVDLQLSDLSMEAGSSISYEVTAVDRYGNETSTVDALVEADDIWLEIGDGTMTSTTPGLYAVSATLGSSVDVETFSVVPGPPATIDLVVPVANVELNDTLHCEILVEDVFGNPTEDPWTMWTEGTGSTAISYRNVSFIEEGEFTIFAQVDDTSLFDFHGPIHVDSTGPLLEIYEPPHGHWSEGLAGTISGTVNDEHSGVASLTVGGDSVPYDGAGNFAWELAYDFGTNILQTEAVDTDGNATTDVRAALAGEFLPHGEGVPDGLTVFIGNNESGFGAIKAMADEMLTEELDLQEAMSSISNPVVSEYSESCVDPCFGLFGGCSFCFTWYSIELNVGNPSAGPSTFDLWTESHPDPAQSGYIGAQFAIDYIAMDWWGNGVVAEIGSSGSGDITADNVVADMLLRPYIDGGQLEIEITSVETSLTVNFNMDGWLYDVLSFFGLDGFVDGLIEDLLRDVVADLVYDEIPPLMEDLLQGLSIDQTFDLGGVPGTFTGNPSSVWVDDLGLELGLETQMVADTWIHPDMGLGSLYTDNLPPAFSNGTGFGIGFALDLLNQLLYEAWGAGLLDQEMSGEELGLGGDEVGIIFPGATDLQLTVDALLPPVAVEDGSSIDFQIGDMYIALHNGPYSDNDIRLELYLSLSAPLELLATGTAIELSLGTPSLFFDVVHPDANSLGASSTEALFEALVPMLLSSVTGSLDSIELPALGDFAIQNMTSVLQDSYLQISAEVQLQ
jgi:hypothetical protein